MGVEFVRQRGDKITYSGRLTVTTCWCGIPHAVPDELYAYVLRQQRDGRAQTGIHCPLGHTWTFAGEGEAERLAREVERERAVASRLRAEKEAERRSHIATKGHATRLKKRIAAGVCPCCKRSFNDLARHMAGKHPEYPSEA